MILVYHGLKKQTTRISSRIMDIIILDRIDFIKSLFCQIAADYEIKALFLPNETFKCFRTGY
jgi:hypothetical protein